MLTIWKPILKMEVGSVLFSFNGSPNDNIFVLHGFFINSFVCFNCNILQNKIRWEWYLRWSKSKSERTVEVNKVLQFIIFETHLFSNKKSGNLNKGIIHIDWCCWNVEQWVELHIYRLWLAHIPLLILRVVQSHTTLWVRSVKTRNQKNPYLLEN